MTPDAAKIPPTAQSTLDISARSTLRWLFWITCILIVYGSLYPFDFSPPSRLGWQAFFSPLQIQRSRPDIVSNIVLFIPLGLFAALGFGRQWGRVALFGILGALFAVALQLLQLYLPSRTAALTDAVWNFIGLSLGIAGASFAHKKISPSWSGTRHLAWARFSFLALWLSAELLPFVPTLDWQTLKDGIKPQLVAPRFHFDLVLLHAAGIAAAAEIVVDQTGVTRTRLGIALAAIFIFFAKIFVYGLGLDWSTLLGFGIGVATWLGLSRHAAWFRRNAVFWIVLGAITVATLLSGSDNIRPSRVNWIPFAAMLQGSMLDNVRALAQSAFLIGALLWLGSHRNDREWSIAVALALWLSLLEIVEFFIGGHTADITKPLLAFLLVPAARLMRSHFSGKLEKASPMVDRETISVLPNHSYKRLSIVVVMLVIAMATTFSFILKLPQIPYNVRELFLNNGAFPRLILFSMALLSVGAGSAWLARHLARSRLPIVTLPIATLAAAVTTLILLRISVTSESVLDISGSNNLYWFVINKDIWGTWGRQLFILLGSATPVEFFERPVRFTALLAPLLLGIALIATLFSRRISAYKRVVILLSAIPWLWLSKGIAFDWSSTDNLNELIARNGAFGLGGGAYLYLLLLLVCAQVVAMAGLMRRLRTAWIAPAILIVGVPIGWWLLNLGLEPRVHKYEQVFSGVQFLLGPDRTRLISPNELFARWALVHVGLVCTLSAAYLLMSEFLTRSVPPKQTGRAPESVSDKASAAGATSPSQREPLV